MPGEKILVVDDEPQIRSLLRSLLSRQGYEVTEAGDGAEALSLCEKGFSFDLVVTDVVMPQMDGLQLSRKIAALRPSTRVLFMSGKCEFEQVASQVSEFGFGFIKKPFAVEELRESVRNQLRVRGMARPARKKRPQGGVTPAK
ncbi:MAG TPA: response regulator [Bryobacteraceae bacterium]|nr:response regulator [Bryobacteraceae bacterium]HOL70600.1 response regulator [Bryobacteraceae bacterium]HOQ46534.1 response regulator [Bryobacteraceae bacterium]HPU73325.1 response regulator [Bryobacteraceae bacterium]